MTEPINFNTKRLERGIAENKKIGGTVILKYPYLPPDFRVAAPVRDLYIGVSQFEAVSVADQKGIIRSVKNAIKKVSGKVVSGKAMQDEAIGMAQDIVLYTAHEIVRGRLTFDDLEYAE